MSTIPSQSTSDGRPLTPEDPREADRQLEIRATQALGMTVRLHTLHGVTYWVRVDRGGTIRRIWRSALNALSESEETAWKVLALHFLTDGNASDQLLAEADRRCWDWSESKNTDDYADGEDQSLTFTCSFYENRMPYKHLGVDFDRTDRRRARLRAFLDAVDAWEKAKVP